MVKAISVGKWFRFRSPFKITDICVQNPVQYSSDKNKTTALYGLVFKWTGPFEYRQLVIQTSKCLAFK